MERIQRAEVYLTESETAALHATAAAWNAVCDALGPNPRQLVEAQNLIHALQRIIMGNVTARAFPGMFRVEL